MKGVSIIAALSSNRVIGDKGKIPWHIPEDFKLFKEKTINSVVIMGSKTWDSLPIKPLPERINIVLSSRKLQLPLGVECFSSIESAIKYAKKFNKDIFLIGGSKVYSDGMKYCDKMFLSHVKGEFNGDTVFPEFNSEKWTVFFEKEYSDFVFKEYHRKS